MWLQHLLITLFVKDKAKQQCSWVDGKHHKTFPSQKIVLRTLKRKEDVCSNLKMKLLLDFVTRAKIAELKCSLTSEEVFSLYFCLPPLFPWGKIWGTLTLTWRLMPPPTTSWRSGEPIKPTHLKLVLSFHGRPSIKMLSNMKHEVQFGEFWWPTQESWSKISFWKVLCYLYNRTIALYYQSRSWNVNPSYPKQVTKKHPSLYLAQKSPFPG